MVGYHHRQFVSQLERHDGIFHVTVLLLVYFCDQFVAPGNSSQQTSLQCMSMINMVFSGKDKILIITYKYAKLSIHRYIRRGIKIGALKMQFVCIFFHTYMYLLNICRKFEFLISQVL